MIRIPVKRFVSVWIVLFFCSSSIAWSNDNDRPVLLVSINPLAMIADAVAGDIAEIRTLLPANISPHTYRLTFSDRRQIVEADLVLWVGPEMETMLRKSFLTKDKSQVIEAGSIEGIHWPEAETRHAVASEHEHDRDPHLWLNPENALLIAQQIEAQLSKQFPNKQQVLADNLRRFSADVEAFVQGSRRQTFKIKGVGFIVLHDAYQHLVEFYELNQQGVIRLNDGTEKGLRHRAELLQYKGRVRCVFSEPQFSGNWAAQLAQPLSAQVAELDPMGRWFTKQSKSNHYSYLLFMQSIIDSLTDCLQGSAEP